MTLPDMGSRAAAVDAHFTQIHGWAMEGWPKNIESHQRKLWLRFDQMSLDQKSTTITEWTNVPKVWILDTCRILFYLENL